MAFKDTACSDSGVSLAILQLLVQQRHELDSFPRVLAPFPPQSNQILQTGAQNSNRLISLVKVPPEPDPNPAEGTSVTGQQRSSEEEKRQIPAKNREPPASCDDVIREAGVHGNQNPP